MGLSPKQTAKIKQIVTDNLSSMMQDAANMLVSAVLKSIVTHYQKNDLAQSDKKVLNDSKTAATNNETNAEKTEASAADDAVSAQNGEVKAQESEAKANTSEATALESGASAVRTKAGASDIETKAMKMN
ncbi:MAG TPA: hypothetical protein H9898_02980 [Candidatus Anaerobiospirillum stercoravium]|nr:hypothetical protein [Candidatus Anaerobiospirillum stercoravium]